ncbi:unnamed protein product [Meganyctiphanes norvegica]|uniref:Protein sleepless n=1 Tax=Meganyctiphanes norvegica TaxID=48144 RepID=A0AAV2RSD6_MEGNR
MAPKLLALVFLLPLFKTGHTLSCYGCHSADSSLGDYDATCAEDGYTGNVMADTTVKVCFTEVYTDGSGVVRRSGWPTSGWSDGSCYETGHSIMCFCSSDTCNSDLCFHCSFTTVEPHTTSEHSTTEHSTSGLLTTSEGNTTDDITTEPLSTTILPPVSTTPVKTLNCYSCFNCAIVDSDTPVADNGDYKACFTSLTHIGTEAVVIRGGDYDEHGDGECDHENSTFTCYCTGDLCNDAEV